MDTARCLDDEKDYGIIEFERLNKQQLGILRQSLVCTSCGGPAYFRKRSSNGKKACFGAHHSDTCELATGLRSVLSKREMIEVKEIVNKAQSSTNEMILDFSLRKKILATSSNSQSFMGAKESPEVIKSKCFEKDPVIEKISKQSLTTVLSALISKKNFTRLNLTIYPSFSKSSAGYAVKDLFINFSDIDYEKHIEVWKGFWGILSGAKLDKNRTLWPNTAGAKDNKFSVCITEEMVNSIQEKIQSVNEEDFLESFSGAYLLVFSRSEKVAKIKNHTPVGSGAHFL